MENRPTHECRCGRWKTLASKLCGICKAFEENAEKRAALRERLDPDHRRPHYDEHGRPIKRRETA